MEQEEVVTEGVEPEVTETEGDEEPTVEDYLKIKERLAKAEKKLVELKKSKKEEWSKESEELIEAKLAERDFYRDHPEFKDYKDEVSTYVKKWLSYDEAASLVKSKDPSFGNKEKAKAASISGGESGASKTVYTAAELMKMPQAEYNQVKALELAWKVRFTR